MNKAHEAATPSTGHAEREAFEKWRAADGWSRKGIANEIAFNAGFQAGRSALLAEIKATKPWLYGDVPLYRLPEGE